LNQRQVLELFESGAYVLEPVAPDELENGGGWRILNRRRQTVQQFTCHRGYLWVRLYQGRARRAVAIHRIVWMVHHQRTIPRGRVIHHAGCKRLNRIDELVLVTRGQHKKIHAARDRAALEEFLYGEAVPF
jgi:hypothetical protein